MSEIVSQNTLWNDEALKCCPQCNRSFPNTTDYFHRNKSQVYGLSHICKQCAIAFQVSYNEQNKAANVGKNPYAPDKTKYCPRCKQTKPTTEEYFGKNAVNRDGLHDICKICNRAHVAAYKEAKRKEKAPRQKATHCPKGHPLVEGNLRKGKRECLTCHRERELQRNRAKGAVPLLSGTHGRGTPDKCPHGHDLTPDNIKKGTKRGCLVCHRESAKRRYHKDPQRMVAEATAYRKTHLEQVRERFRRYRKQDSWRARARASSMRRRARKSATGSVSLQEQRLYDDVQSRIHIESLLKDPCCYCGKPMEHIDHIVPIAKNGEEHWTNLTAACQRCNNRKIDKSLLDFLMYRLEHPDLPEEGNE